MYQISQISHCYDGSHFSILHRWASFSLRDFTIIHQGMYLVRFFQSRLTKNAEQNIQQPTSNPRHSHHDPLPPPIPPRISRPPPIQKATPNPRLPTNDHTPINKTPSIPTSTKHSPQINKLPRSSLIRRRRSTRLDLRTIAKLQPHMGDRHCRVLDPHSHGRWRAVRDWSIE